jgi:microcystin-dependent protein
MADLALANSTYANGTNDTASTLVNNVSATDAQQWNGVATACVGIETILGTGTDLKGTAADLVARLTVLLQASGRIKDKDGGTTYTKYDGWLGYDSNTLRKFRNLGFPGEIVMSSLSTVPTGWLECNGAPISCSTYEDLFDMVIGDLAYGSSTYLGWRYHTATFTFTGADVNTTTDTITKTAHGLSNGPIIHFTTDGTLPGGITTKTKYYVISATTNSFQVSTTLNGSPVDITSTGTGTHSLYTHFVLPDYQSRSPIGAGTGSGLSTRTVNVVTGTETHTLTVGEMPAHTHTLERVVAENPHGPLTGVKLFNATTVTTLSTSTDGGGGAHNNMPPVFGIKFLVRY